MPQYVHISCARVSSVTPLRVSTKHTHRFRISRFKYDPVPGVDGALVTFKLIPLSKRLLLPGGEGGERKFMQLVYRGFDQRRKMLRNSLQPAFTPPQVRIVCDLVCG